MEVNYCIANERLLTSYIRMIYSTDRRFFPEVSTKIDSALLASIIVIFLHCDWIAYTESSST